MGAVGEDSGGEDQSGSEKDEDGDEEDEGEEKNGEGMIRVANRWLRYFPILKTRSPPLIRKRKMVERLLRKLRFSHRRRKALALSVVRPPTSNN